MFAGVQDILLVSHPKGYAQTAGRFLYYTVPFSAMAATFVATSCAANSLRGKNDYWNYIIGGVSSGSIYGVWQKSLNSGIKAGIVLSLVACMKKWSVDEGFSILGEPVREKRLFNSAKYDYSALKE